MLNGFSQKLVFKTKYRLMQVQSIAEFNTWEHSAILLTFIKHTFFIRSLFCLFLSDRFTQVLLNAY